MTQQQVFAVSLYAGVVVFWLGIIALTALMLGEIGKTTRWRTPVWMIQLQSVLGRAGRHTRRPRYISLRPALARFLPGRAAVGYAPVEPTPDPVWAEPGESEAAEEPDPLTEEPVDPDFAELERQFRSGYTITDPRFAAILREAYARAEAGVR